MALRLEQVLCLLKIYSKNENTINVLLRVHYLRYINLHFANNQWLFDLQIHFRFERPYNATNTTNFLPNQALCLVQVETLSHYLLTHNSRLFNVPSPICSISEWWLSVFSWKIFFYFGQSNWQIFFINHLRHSIHIINRKWLSPISLSRKNCITQTIIYFGFSCSYFL